MTVYTTGYLGDGRVSRPDVRKATALRDLVLRLNASTASRESAVLADIRMRPYSRGPMWREGALKSLVGEANYLHVPQLGNINYNRDAPIKIGNMDEGIRRLAALGRPVLLLCGCESPEGCHRAVVAAELRARGCTVTKIDVWDTFPAPDQTVGSQRPLPGGKEG